LLLSYRDGDYEIEICPCSNSFLSEGQESKNPDKQLTFIVRYRRRLYYALK
jgi:hypothetical protein